MNQVFQLAAAGTTDFHRLYVTRGSFLIARTAEFELMTNRGDIFCPKDVLVPLLADTHIISATVAGAGACSLYISSPDEAPL